MATKTYTVLREHEGDRYYSKGETRELDSAEAKHLIDLKVLKESAEQAARCPEDMNKADLVEVIVSDVRREAESRSVEELREAYARRQEFLDDTRGDEGEKTEGAPANKSEPAPANKAEPVAKGKAEAKPKAD